jgi:hypothetical protein
MRAYKFLDAHFGLKSLYERRLKQSRINDLNDPFELIPYDLTDPDFRDAFLKTRDQIDSDRAVLCFSASWHDPVIWAHYSDKHRGLCLGFEIPEMQGNVESDESRLVIYEPTPLKFPSDFADLPDAERFAIVQKVLFTKYEHWAYEEEIRFWAPLQNEENGLHFLEFDDKLKLVEIIIGARSTVTESALKRAIGTPEGQVKIIKARAAYDKFQMVEDEDWSSTHSA